MSVSRIGCPASIRNLGGVVGHRHRDFEHDHLVGAGTRTTALVRSRLDCQINADNNRCRGTDPPLNTGRFIGLDRRLVHHPEGIIAGLDMRNPGEYEAALR
jgi:hypothetical protein